ncbi:N-acetyl-alpha-D-glucosaminyl L-malate synthase BshA [Ferrimonas sp. SCSIO 43195]|uniref:N-acetyl-alpha-D-glucosaminyl L-malate synthase BshA n=1 Tax=Ferrimonas sp. SCSIO 43195 TaxID=2822844 RepID=UPI0020754BB0|nr:N-acetyl-alpha-D-glucosaminyl L-malate synthase BshA [Ferrimonas sp. SCSIO 43195]USD35849.1 N-acetyl-alpha-D-glucosaminyl L-malate synthase BshA [Ferrimonas sp. SCSIO 43195]
MKIGIVCHPSIGGSGLVATELGHELARLGHEVHFISSAPPFKLSRNQPNVHFHLVEAIHYPLFQDPLYTFALTAKIVEVVNQYQLQVVHAHYSIPHSLCAYLASEITDQPFPVVTTIHGTDVTVVGQDRPLYPLNQFSINRSTRVTTVSNFQRHYIHRHFQVDAPIEVIHNFIDLQRFSPDNPAVVARHTLAKGEEKIVMHLSNFRPVKNTQTVINAFARLSSALPARLVLLGSGPSLEPCQTLCHQLGISERVHFIGEVRNVEHYLPLADCVIQPSYRESFCMALLEAMACGVPTVSSDVDGIPEVVEHGVSGYMAPADDVEAHSRHLLAILTDPQRQRRFGQAGRRRAAERFHPAEKAEQYLACYRQAINACLLPTGNH